MAELGSNYISLMADSLRKKAQVLEALIKLSAKQHDILTAEPFELDDFDSVVHEKADYIEQLEKLDDGFAGLFEKVKTELEGRKEQYADEIKQMQELIRHVTDLSVQVEAQEKRNQPLAAKQFSALKKEVREAKMSTSTASKYYKSMSRVESTPQFIDRKN